MVSVKIHALLTYDILCLSYGSSRYYLKGDRSWILESTVFCKRTEVLINISNCLFQNN